MAARRPSSPAPTAISISARGGGAGAALQHLLARQHELHRAPALLREPHRHGLAVDGDLAAEAAADLERHDLELRRRQAEHRGNHQLGGELPLRGGPHGGKAVGVDLAPPPPAARDSPGARCRPARSIRAVAARGAERSLRIAARDHRARADVARRSRARLDALGEDMLVQHGRVGRHGRRDIEHGRQRLVVDLDQRQRRLGHMHVHGGDRRDRLPDPVDLAARHVDLRHHPHVVAGLAHRDRGADRQLGEIRRAHHRQHALQRHRARRIDAQDARMRVRAAQQLARAPCRAAQGPPDSAPRR